MLVAPCLTQISNLIQPDRVVVNVNLRETAADLIRIQYFIRHAYPAQRCRARFEYRIVRRAEIESACLEVQRLTNVGLQFAP